MVNLMTIPVNVKDARFVDFSSNYSILNAFLCHSISLFGCRNLIKFSDHLLLSLTFFNLFAML